MYILGYVLHYGPGCLPADTGPKYSGRNPQQWLESGPGSLPTVSRPCATDIHGAFTMTSHSRLSWTRNWAFWVNT